MISFSPERSGLHRTSQAAQMLTSLLSKIILGAIRTAQTTPHLSWKNSWVGQCHNLFFVSMIGLGLFWEHLSKIFMKCMKSNVRFCSTRKSLARPMLGPYECGLPSKWKCLLAGAPSKWRCWDLRYVCSSFLSCSFPCKIHLLPFLYILEFQALYGESRGQLHYKITTSGWNQCPLQICVFATFSAPLYDHFLLYMFLLLHSFLSCSSDLVR